MCCLLTIIVILIVGVFIVYTLRSLYNKTRELLKTRQDKLTSNTSTTTPMKFVETTTPKVAARHTNDEIYDTAYFSTSPDEHPSLRLCPTTFTCEFTTFCNIQICRHVAEIARIDYDKNTVKNVTYIHLPKCIIIFITKNHNVCKREQEVKLEEDINYINAYASKYVDSSIYTVYYDNETQKFIDNTDAINDHYTIYINEESSKRELMETTYKSTQPTAPHSSLQNTQSLGQFFYIAK